jgi:hypothetical protein
MDIVNNKRLSIISGLTVCYNYVFDMCFRKCYYSNQYFINNSANNQYFVNNFVNKISRLKKVLSLSLSLLLDKNFLLKGASV